MNKTKGKFVADTGRDLRWSHWVESGPMVGNDEVVSMLAYIAQLMEDNVWHLRRAADDLERIYAAIPEPKHAKPRRKAKRKAKARKGRGK